VRAISPSGSVDRDWSEVLKRPDGKFVLSGWTYAAEAHVLATLQKQAAHSTALEKAAGKRAGTAA
jgi:hypothetical protein